MHLYRALSVSFLVPLALVGCSQPARQEIAEVREPTSPRRQAPPKADTKQRLDMGGMGGASQSQQDALGGITFHADVPQGWEKLAETQFRQVNLRMKEVPEAECYFTLLPGGGGGLDANINRWRAQMGLEPMGPEEIAALPKKPIFGQPGTYVDITGTFTGMGEGPVRENYRMYGLILHHSDAGGAGEQAFFLKMTGPADVLAGQEANFERIASSLHAVAPGDDHTHDHDHDDHSGHDHPEGEGHDHEAESSAPPMTNPHAGASAMSSPSAPPAGEYQYTLPEGWEALAPRMMREANVTIAGQPDVECYLTVLSGRHGGVEMNINRWRAQMGQDDLSAEAIAALPKATLMGGEASFVTIDGTFGGMSGEVAQQDFRMYGLVRVDGETGYFVKMTGPRAVLEAQEANFLAFSASLASGGVPAAPAPAPAPAADAAPMPADPHGVTGAAPAESGALQWMAPEGWQDGGERMMREVTYEMGETECYIAVLPGDAGGVEANINRWVGQMGQPALDEAAIAALPKIALLGQQAPLVESAGDFTNMRGESIANYKMLGSLVATDTHMIFVKMTGPAAEVDAQRENFIAFCASIQGSAG